MKHRTVITVCMIIVLVCLWLLGSGCAYAHAVTGQGLDMATSCIGINNGCDELNPISGDNMLTLAAIKAGLLAVTWLIGDEDVNAIVGGAGYAAAAWNAGQIMRGL